MFSFFGSVWFSVGKNKLCESHTQNRAKKHFHRLRAQKKKRRIKEKIVCFQCAFKTKKAFIKCEQIIKSHFVSLVQHILCYMDTITCYAYKRKSNADWQYEKRRSNIVFVLFSSHFFSLSLCFVNVSCECISQNINRLYTIWCDVRAMEYAKGKMKNHKNVDSHVGKKTERTKKEKWTFPFYQIKHILNDCKHSAYI